MANELRTNAVVRYQNALVPIAALTAIAGSWRGAGGSPGTSDGVPGSSRAGAGRMTSACSGTVTAARIRASVISARRQPWRSISQFDSGEKTKLAKPPTSVTAVNAWRRRVLNHLV